MKSPLPDVAFPTNLSVTQALLPKLREYGNRVALIDGLTGRRMTFRDLHRDVMQVAHNLRQRGLRKGDFVFICTHNCLEFPVALLAVIHLGGIMSTCNPAYTVDEVLSQMSDCKPKFAFAASEDVGAKVTAASNRCGGVEEVFVFGDAAGCTPFRKLCARGKCDDVTEVSPALIDPGEDLAVLPYSSGTTGKAKGVMLTHTNLIANIFQLRVTDVFKTPVCRRGEQGVIMGVLPFFHIYGLVCIVFSSLYVGDAVVVLPRFELGTFLKAIQDHKVTWLFIVPPIALMLAKDPQVALYDMSSVESLNSGAAPLGGDTIRDIRERLGLRDVRQGYGLTETSPVALASPCCTAKYGSSGLIVPNTEIKIVDPDSGQDLGPNQDGELWIRGPHVMKGYYKRPEATASTVDREGWLHSGDVGHYDDDGYFYVVDRLKELIKYKGFQVPPAEVESLLLTHPGVRDVAVIGVPDEMAGELPRAFVVLKDGQKVSGREIAEFVAANAAPHKRLRGGVELVTEIPKSASGKILRRVLRQRVKDSLIAKL